MQVGPDATDAGRARIRLLLITDTPISVAGGSERFLRNLVSLLPHDRYAITLVQLSAGHDRRTEKQPLYDCVRVASMHMPVAAVYGRDGWRALRALRRLVAEENFDIVQSQHEKSDLFNALLSSRAGCIRISNRRDAGFKKSSKLRWAFRFLNHRYHGVIAPSQPILEDLATTEALDVSRMLWIPNGVDTARFRPLPDAERRAARAALGLDEQSLAFGCLANLNPVKRHADLLAAFAQLHATTPEARLLLIGDGPLRGEVEAQASSLGIAGAVTLLGLRTDIASLLPALDVGMLASSSEGMSNAILEMMACGLPVIATAVGGTPSLVEHDATGLLVPAREPATLCAAMSLLAQSPDARRRLGNAARTRIEREFSLDAMVRSFDQAYRRLLGLA